MNAQFAAKNRLFCLGVIGLLVAGWGARHAYRSFEAIQGVEMGTFKWVYTFVFTLLAIQVILCMLERPTQGDGIRQNDYVVVVVPAFNEHPDILRRCLCSAIDSTRKPNEIVVVDDGSNKVDYTNLITDFRTLAGLHDIRTQWIRTENGGKRHAQITGVNATPQATIYVTVDSDGILDQCAIEEGLKPFSDNEVQSVCGIVLAANNRTNILSRFTDLLYVTGQFVDRSSMSAVGNVLVNSGVLALYRAAILRDNTEAYLNETFCGRPVQFSDDSMLTLFAKMRGKTVQQPSAFVFTAMPETVSHHIRQYTRWMRGSFIRSIWRLRYLPVNSWGYWRQLLGFCQVAMSTVVFVSLFIVGPMSGTTIRSYVSLLFIPLCIGYGQALRYFTFRRSDMSWKAHLGIFMWAPVAWMWQFTILRVVRFYAMFTCLNTGWGTRQNGAEVALDR